MFSTKVRQSTAITKILSETTQDLDDDDLENTFTSHHNGAGLTTGGANGSHSSLSTISSNKESPTS